MEQETIQYDIQLNDLKNDFNDLYEASNDVEVMFETLDAKIKKLNTLYNDLLKTNSDKKILVFGLDSFNFQTLAIHEETKHLKRFRNLLYNRIYADYFKLNKLILSYVKENFETKSKLCNKLSSNLSQFPKYDYLNIYKYYDFNLINDMFQDIISNIQSINDHSKSLQMKLHFYKQKGNIGLNINNFVHGHEYMNNNIRSQIKLFVNYIHFFLNLHTKYLTNFITNMKLMHARLRSDINLDEYVFTKNNSKSEKVKQSEPANTFLNSVEKEQFEMLLENTDDSNIIHRSMSKLINSMSPSSSETIQEKKVITPKNEFDIGDLTSVIDEEITSEEEISVSEKLCIEDKREKQEIEENTLVLQNDTKSEKERIDELVNYIEGTDKSTNNVVESKSKKRRRRKKKKH